MRPAASRWAAHLWCALKTLGVERRPRSDGQRRESAGQNVFQYVKAGCAAAGCFPHLMGSP
jgi:hypothetical protein